MIFEIFLLLLGVFLISKGSDWAAESIVPTARRLATSKIAIGMILVSMFVSLPEVFIAVWSVINQHTEIGLGTIMGSVIANIGLIAGLCAYVKPVRVSRHVLLRDGIFLLSAAFIVLLLTADMRVTRTEGLVLLLMFVPYVINVWEQEKADSRKLRRREIEDIVLELRLTGLPFNYRFYAGYKTLLLGLAALVIGSDVFVRGMMGFGGALGIPDILMGLTFGAIGSTIPNIAAALQATMRGHESLVIPETVGANVFTLLVTLGIISAMSPIAFNVSSFLLNVPAMIAMNVILFAAMLTRGRISRLEGATLLVLYVSILTYQVLARAA